MTIEGIIDLHEYRIHNNIKGEKYHLAVETYLEALVEHKKIYGSVKHLLKMKNSDYEKAMEERKSYALGKAMEVIKK